MAKKKGRPRKTECAGTQTEHDGQGSGENNPFDSQPEVLLVTTIVAGGSDLQNVKSL